MSLDFRVKLSKYHCKNQIFQHILIIVKKLKKQILYKPLETLKTAEFIDAIYKKVFATYRFSLITVNNKGGQMTSMLWKWLASRYDINIKFSSAHHLGTDGQIESANRIIKNYFCIYINHMRDDWIDNLPMVEFAVSNHINALTRVMLFFADYGFHSRTGIKPSGIYKGE